MNITPEYSSLERIRVKLTENEIKAAILQYVDKHNGGIIPRKAFGMTPSIELYEEGGDNNPQTVAEVIFTFEQKLDK